MLQELDIALRALVERDIGQGTDVQLDFDAPTKEWATRRNRPTIDIYLYDIRQDMSRAQFGQMQVRTAEGVVTQRRPQPKYFRLAYLVTAWTQRAEDEHRLLSRLLVTFLKYETIPAELLTGSLADAGISIPIALGLPPPQDRSLSDVWSALGGELKPSLDMSIIAPLLPERFTDAGPPVLAEPVITMVGRGTGGTEDGGGRPMPDGWRDDPAAGRPPPAPAPPPPTAPSRARKRAAT